MGMPADPVGATPWANVDCTQPVSTMTVVCCAGVAASATGGGPALTHRPTAWVGRGALLGALLGAGVSVLLAVWAIVVSGPLA